MFPSGLDTLTEEQRAQLSAKIAEATQGTASASGANPPPPSASLAHIHDKSTSADIALYFKEVGKT